MPDFSRVWFIPPPFGRRIVVVVNRTFVTNRTKKVSQSTKSLPEKKEGNEIWICASVIFVSSLYFSFSFFQTTLPFSLFQRFSFSLSLFSFSLGRVLNFVFPSSLLLLFSPLFKRDPSTKKKEKKIKIIEQKKAIREEEKRKKQKREFFFFFVFIFHFCLFVCCLAK